MSCPVCNCNTFQTVKRYSQVHPYVECTACGLLYNPNPPSKTYESSIERPGNEMSEADKGANRAIAK